jgi:hypothetical protein
MFQLAPLLQEKYFYEAIPVDQSEIVYHKDSIQPKTPFNSTYEQA